MKKIIMMVVMLGLTGGVYAAEMCAGQLVCFPNGPLGGEMPHGQNSPQFSDLAVHASAINAQAAARDTAVPPVPAPVAVTAPRLSGIKKSLEPAVTAPEDRTDPFDVRKLYVIPATDAWQGPFVVQFWKSADLAAVKNVLKLTGLKQAELKNDGNGYYARVQMDYEFAGIMVMNLTDYTSVRYVAVNQKLWDIMSKY